MKTLWFGITHDDAKIDQGVLTFAIATGWKDKIPSTEDPKILIDNPVSPIDHSGDKIWEYISQTVIGYNAQKGQELGRENAIQSTLNGFVGIAHETSIESLE